jgi:7-cyano-7-deazaguanine reductase
MRKTRSKSKTRVAGLTQLGRGATKPSRRLEAFPNDYPGRDTEITFHCAEFSCLCPVTGQPDFATLEISYIPGEKVLESKSLKLYLWTYRDTGIFHENVANAILDDLHRFLKPRWLSVAGHFNLRGGIAIDVVVERGQRRAEG